MPLSLHYTLGWLGALVTLALVGFWVPPAEPTIGESYLIFFFHFPSAVNCLNMFLFAGVVCLLYLARRKPSLDLWAASAIEVGLVATAVTLATGSIWAKAAWGLWWDMSDPRLMSVAVMFLIYWGYVALRASLPDALRPTLTAVFGAFAALNVPVVLYSIRVLGQSSHPPMGVEMGEVSMIATRWIGAAAFLILYTAMWRSRFAVLQSKARLDHLTHRMLNAES